MARLEFSATYLMEKSLARIAASMAPLAAATTASNEYALVQALATSSGRSFRAPMTDATTPYTASTSPRRRANEPMRSISRTSPVGRTCSASVPRAEAGSNPSA